jgi:hypothetical protein
MLQAKAALMAERERQKSDEKRAKQKYREALGGQENTGDFPLDNS